MKKRKKAVRLPYLVLVPFAASVCLVIWMIFSGALMSTDEATQSLGGIFDGTSAVHWPLIPNSPTLQPLIEVLLDTPEFFVMFWNTCILTFPQLIGQFLLASPAAWAFSRFTFRGRNLLFTIYTILMLLPFQVLMVPDYLVLDRLGLMDTVWSIILPGAVSTLVCVSHHGSALPSGLPSYLCSHYFSLIYWVKYLLGCYRLSGAILAFGWIL